MSHLFQVYGKICATHPWEVIFTVLTQTTIFLTMDKPKYPTSSKQVTPCSGCIEEHFIAADVIVMTIIRCLAILYTYHQFRNLQKLGSKYILGFAGLFVVFSSFVFTSAVLSILQIEVVDLKDALFFFLLLIDLTKAAKLAQFALSSANEVEISENIARGVAVLGPTITLDTLVETLVIGVGTLSGVHRLEMLSYFACLSVIVNYVIFMTFYPACLSLVLELGRVSENNGQERAEIKTMLLEENEKSNPAIQRVKIIMSLGLMVVHIHSRWSASETSTGLPSKTVNCTEEVSTYSHLMKQFALSADHIVILILLITLIIKFVFFESRDSLADPAVQQLTEAPVQFKTSPVRPKRTYSTSVEVQTETDTEQTSKDLQGDPEAESSRNLQECLEIYRTGDPAKLSDSEIMKLVDTKHIPAYTLEKAVKNPIRGVRVRRKIIQNLIPHPDVFSSLPYDNYDYSRVLGACCENVVGYVPVPVGIAGPLLLDDRKFFIPLATTEGCLVASTNRGCRAVEKTGIRSRVVADGMTRAPVVRFPSVVKASEAMLWLKRDENFASVKESFDSTSRFAKLQRISVHIAGRNLFIRFVARTGDAMGMNMISKGTEKALQDMRERFPDMEILSLSGNVCTDKKPAAVNWIEGRGKSVVCECVIPKGVVESLLKTNTRDLVNLNVAKNFVGSAVAGSIGGFNAHAANLVTAIFIATGQDPAQNVASSNCITIMEPWGDDGDDLHVSCTMPSIEIGTVGGGTALPAQSACLKMLGVEGPHPEDPGANAQQLARIVCGAVLAGEVSLMAALASGQLVKSHLKYNRSCSSGGSLDSSRCERV